MKNDCPPEPAPAEGDDPQLSDDWAALLASEAAAIGMRRERVLGPAAIRNAAEMNLPTVGLALSGGGVRSATFALGLMRGLARRQMQSGGAIDASLQSQDAQNAQDAQDARNAQNTLSAGGLLGRLDYLSTVSGGGYIGGMYGRLVATYGIECAQGLLARGHSPVLDWLRRNGRYLTPAGSRDIGIAVVTYFRSWLAIHVEFMFACIFLGLLIVAPHLWNHSVQVLRPEGWEPWHTLWWAVSLAVWTALAPGLIAGYWAARDVTDPAARGQIPGWRDALFLIVLAVGVWAFTASLGGSVMPDAARNGLSLPMVGVLALSSLVAGQLAAMVWMALSREPHALKVARLRNRLTRALRVVLLGTLALAGMGALDRLSWWLLEEMQTGNRWLWGGVGLGSVVLVVLRALMQPLQQMAANSDRRAREWLPRLLDFGSLLGLLVLVTAWLVVVQWFVFAPETLSALTNAPPLIRAGLLALVWAAWIIMTAGNSQTPNASSLHSFYRARLNRAYLAVGNRQRSMDQAGGIRVDVTRVVEGDDTRLRHYRPETQGGPIHLVNTCLNQTRDDKSGLYNADRKGAALTATWRGIEVGPREFIAFRPEMDVGTLGRWVAVSGAAASPGAGAYTSRGLALLVYFLGVRLGHWMRAPQGRVQLRWLSRLGWRLLPKPLMLSSEASATFFGTERPWWYLSDGGHFENSGVYALLKREVGFILASDASSDARYEFADLENLVRKARIDFGAEIDFYTADEAKDLFCLGSNELTVLSPEDMVNNHSCRGVLLARIRYRERAGKNGRPHRPEGTLLVIKPNLHDALDVDLLGYARRHEAFPHEPTGDQSFDEAQWESYHRLGEDFGRALHESWLAQLPGWRSPAHHAIRVAARLGPTQVLADSARNEPLWRRSARATAIGTTLGLGASGTLLLSLWQVQDQLQRSRAEEQAQARQLFTDVSKGLESFRGACPQIPEHVVTQASILLQLSGSPVLRKLEQDGVDRLATRIAEECEREVDASEQCVAAQNRIQASLCAPVNRQRAASTLNEVTALSYWKPITGPAAQAEQARTVLRDAASRFPVFGTLFDTAPQVAARAEGKAAGDDNYSAAWGGGIASQVQQQFPGVPRTRAAEGPVTGAAPALPSPAPQASGQAAAVARSLSACARASGRTTLYVQVYDEASRSPATALRQALLAESGSPVVVAPLENVTRSADLRQQRRPVPWPKPTLILHDPESRDCARAIARYIGAPWLSSAAPGDTDRVWLRDLPRNLKPRPGVIELWLPPLEVSVAQNAIALTQVAGGPDPSR
jgi:hypothetical protein